MTKLYKYNKGPIGLVGPARVGKDTVCNILRTLNPTKYRIAFADFVKKEICNWLDITTQELEDNKTLFRPLLQWWGNEYRKVYLNNPNYWITRLEDDLNWQELALTRAIITDVRFQNEANWIMGNNGILVRVLACRPDVIREHSKMNVEHISETEQAGIKCSVIIRNNGTVDELERTVMGIEI